MRTTIAPAPALAYIEMQVEIGYLTSSDPAKYLTSIFKRYGAELLLRVELSPADRAAQYEDFISYVHQHLEETVQAANALYAEIAHRRPGSEHAKI